MKLSRNNLLILHGLLGFLLKEFSFLSTYFGLLIILLGTYYILGKSDPLEKYPLIFSAYMVGIEVVLRMTGAILFWEFGKYGVIYFLLLGLIRRSKKIQIYPPILFYFILLLPAVLFLQLNPFDLWRQQVAFNLSGPAALLLSAIYFSNRIINKELLSQILFYMVLPIVTMTIYNILAMPDLSTYQFLPYSDFDTSGGYGPNQVSTIFGLGIVSILISLVLKINLFENKIINIIVLGSFISLGLITFSRGGILAAIISFTGGVSYYFFHNQKKIFLILNSCGLLLLSIIAWVTIVSITDGVIMQRYGIGETKFGDSFILDLTGRAEIYKIDITIFSDYILTGVGPGQATELREHYGYNQKVAAHTEYSRMLAEHGILGLFSLLILLSVSVLQMFRSNVINIKLVKIMFGLLALLTMGHSAMRIAMPSFLLGFLLTEYED